LQREEFLGLEAALLVCRRCWYAGAPSTVGVKCAVHRPKPNGRGIAEQAGRA
jgi:hypothetical protein